MKIFESKLSIQNGLVVCLVNDDFAPMIPGSATQI